jgi:hypothetical protein
MLAIMMYRVRTIGKPAAELSGPQRTVFLIAAEQSKLYFLRGTFSAEYIDHIFAIEKAAAQMVHDMQAVRGGDDNSYDTEDDESDDLHAEEKISSDEGNVSEEFSTGSTVGDIPRLNIVETPPFNLESSTERVDAARIVIRLLIKLERDWCGKGEAEMWPGTRC